MDPETCPPTKAHLRTVKQLGSKRSADKLLTRPKAGLLLVTLEIVLSGKQKHKRVQLEHFVCRFHLVLGSCDLETSENQSLLGCPWTCFQVLQKCLLPTTYYLLNDNQFIVHSITNGYWFMAHGSWPIQRGRAGPPPQPQSPRPFFLAMSFEL